MARNRSSLPLSRVFSRALFGSIACATLFAIVQTGACTNYGDGERCNSKGQNNGNDDCQPGLACTTGLQRSDPTGPDLCCPPDRSVSMSTLCRGAKTTIALPDASLGDSAVVTDAAFVDSAVTSDASSPSDAGGEGG